ncbi:hypothetical protein, conserved [Leishmania tarentolae]|uniref:Uncharacterized protein n=1 Tax=Leishmania tarentolae TaxID=5689 RepID=A0A640K9Q2_LEITA|nr:hypothetical protein, conserved [Leishmania tarentolae]
MLYRRFMRSRITLLLNPIRASVTSATASAQASDDAEASTSANRFVSTSSRSEVVSSSSVRLALTRLMSSAVTRLMSALLTRIRRRSNGSDAPSLPFLDDRDAVSGDDDGAFASAVEKNRIGHRFLLRRGRGFVPPRAGGGGPQTKKAGCGRREGGLGKKKNRVRDGGPSACAAWQDAVSRRHSSSLARVCPRQPSQNL